jgi:beta-propeller repeat-containing protein
MPLDQAVASSLPHRSRHAGLAVALIVPLASGCAPPRSPDNKGTVEPAAWLAAPGLAVGLPGGDAAGLLRWTWGWAEGADRSLAARVNRLVGNPSAWKSWPPTYGELRHNGGYPGVVLTVESRPHAAAYRFDVAPNGQARSIRMRYAGTDKLSVEDGGRALRMRAGGRALREDGLFCYQDVSGSRREVPCRYRITRGGDGAYEVAFDIGAYDRSRRLVVDPIIAWSSYLGGGGNDQGNGIAVDGSGDVYVAGTTPSSDFPSAGGFDTSLDGSLDAFVAKVDPAGSSLVWSSYLGGSGSDSGNGIAVDDSGNVYVTGSTSSSDFPSAGGFAASLGGATDAFVAKVNAAGSSLAWSSYLGGGDDDRGNGVSVDAFGDVYVAGTTSSSDFPSAGGFATSLGGPTDAFVAKVNAAGSSLAWSSYLGGVDDEYGSSVAVDTSGNVYVAGTTYSSDFPASGGFDASLDGLEDAFVTKVDATGSSLVWSSYLGGGDLDEGYAVAVDAGGNAYVTGYTVSTDFPSPGGFDTSFDAAGQAFVTKVDAAGSSLLWSSYLGGSDFDEGFGVAVDGSGNVYVTGDTFSTDFPSPGGFDTSFDLAGEAFVTKVDAAGSSLAWSSYLGGGDSDTGNGVAVGSGNVYVTGYTFSTDFPSPGGFATSLDGTLDAFVTKIADSCGNSTCDAAETPCNCPVDCGADACGNGCCGPAENTCGCPTDCGSICGDACCNGLEDACGCPADCAAVCGDGCCTGAEDCVGCSLDCGNCPEPSPDMTSDAGGDGPVTDGLVTDGPQEASTPDAPLPDSGLAPSPDEGCQCAAGRGSRGGVLSLFALLLLASTPARKSRRGS